MTPSTDTSIIPSGKFDLLSLISLLNRKSHVTQSMCWLWYFYVTLWETKSSAMSEGDVDARAESTPDSLLTLSLELMSSTWLSCLQVPC